MMDRILVVLPNWFGETLFATPFLKALRAQRPQAFIATLGRPQCRAVLQHHPSVNELLDYDERGRHRTWLGSWRLARSLRALQFDTAFLLRNSMSRTWLMCLAGIPTRVGFDNPKSGWLLTRRAVSRQPTHKALSYVPLLEAAGLSAVPLHGLVAPGRPDCSLSGSIPEHAPHVLAHGRTMGVSPQGLHYEYHVSEAERREASAWVAARRWSDGHPMIVLHPGANWPHKRWAVGRFAALGDRLAETLGAHIVITGAAEDLPSASSIIEGMRHPATLVAGQTTVRQLGALLEQAHLVVSNDTGILHMAAALRRPLVALYGPTSPALTGPLGDSRRMIVLHHPDCCPRIPCYAPEDPPHRGMDSITVDEVFNAAAELLKETR